MATRQGSLADKLYHLEIGESIEFPIIELANVRSTASMYGAQWSRTYKTAMNREAGIVTVTRTK